MPGILESVNLRTQLVGKNRLELLLFRLGGEQLYGINVFKVKEVLTCPKLTLIPMRHPIVRGIAHIREETIAIFDLSAAVGGQPLAEAKGSLLIVTEYNLQTQGFLVSSVDRIINKKWDSVHTPPSGTGGDHYLTAVTHSEDQLIEVLDVEKIIAEVIPLPVVINQMLADPKMTEAASGRHVLIVDDSMVARNQMKRSVENVGAVTTVLKDGKEALDHLRALADAGEDVASKYMMLVSDIEMPEMDGYTLTAAINEDERMAGLHILLHTSLSGVFNLEMVKKVGADDFLAKYRPDDLAVKVIERVRQLEAEAPNRIAAKISRPGNRD